MLDIFWVELKGVKLQQLLPAPPTFESSVVSSSGGRLLPIYVGGRTKTWKEYVGRGFDPSTLSGYWLYFWGQKWTAKLDLNPTAPHGECSWEKHSWICCKSSKATNVNWLRNLASVQRTYFGSGSSRVRCVLMDLFVDRRRILWGIVRSCPLCSVLDYFGWCCMTLNMIDTRYGRHSVPLLPWKRFAPRWGIVLEASGFFGHVSGGCWQHCHHCTNTNTNIINQSSP